MTSATGIISLEAAYQHCEAVTKERARNFYFAFKALPKDRRPAIYAVYAFCRACDDYSDDDIPLEEKMTLLEGYRRRLYRTFQGDPDGPVFVALWDAARHYDISLELLDEVIKGVEMDLSVRRYATFDDLRLYCYRVAAVVGLISIRIFGYTRPEAKVFAEDLGIGMQLVNILRDIKEDAARDRVYVPQEDIARFGCSESDLLNGRVTAQFRELMAFEAARSREYFVSGARLLPLLDKTSRACPAILRALYSNLLDRIQERGWDVYTRRVSLTTRQKVWLASTIWTGNTLRNLLPLSR